MKVLALCAVLAAAAAFAESGQPPGVCEEPACFCNTRNCSCGETCNFGRSCSPVESRFCSTDGMCALPCGSFICVNSRCTAGLLPDGGPNVPTPVVVGAPSGPSTPQGCGCSAGADLGLLGAFALLGLRRTAARRG